MLGLVLAVGGASTQAAETAAQLEPGAEEIGGLEFEQLAKIKVTTVTRQESTVQASPAAIFVITPEMIRRSGAATIPELFRGVPGMNVARIDNNKWAIGVRGLNDRFQRFLLAQVDGRSIYSATFAGVYWDAVDYPLEDIERIEIIRGPGASVWGANAVNGIINIITKSSKETQGGLVTAGAGNEERGFGAIRYGGKISDELHYRIYGKGFTRDEQFSLSGNPRDGWRGGNGGLRLDWDANENDAFMFDAGYLQSRAGRRDARPMIAPPFVLANVEDELSHAAHALARWSHTASEDSGWSLQAYWDKFNRNFTGLEEYQRWDTFDLDFQHQFPLGSRQQLIWGLGYRLVDSFLGNTASDDGFILSYVPNHSRQQLFSGFIQDQIALVPDNLSLTLGLKLEHNDFTQLEWQPTARLLWTPTPRQSVWAAASRAVRTPSVADDELRSTLLQSAPGVGPYPQTTGNPNLESEELLAFELGYRIQATEKLSFDTALFYNVYDELRAQVRGADFIGPHGALLRPQLRSNALTAESYGAELAGTWRITGRWGLYGSYSLLKMNVHRPDGGFTPVQLRELAGQETSAERQSPRQQVSLQSSWNLPRDVHFDLIGRWVDELPGFNPPIAAYFALDARLAWRPRENLELSVVGQNLLDNHHPESGASAAVRSPLVEIQRSVYAKIAWHF